VLVGGPALCPVTAERTPSLRICGCAPSLACSSPPCSPSGRSGCPRRRRWARRSGRCASTPPAPVSSSRASSEPTSTSSRAARRPGAAARAHPEEHHHQAPLRRRPEPAASRGGRQQCGCRELAGGADQTEDGGPAHRRGPAGQWGASTLRFRCHLSVVRVAFSHGRTESNALGRRRLGLPRAVRGQTATGCSSGSGPLHADPQGRGACRRLCDRHGVEPGGRCPDQPSGCTAHLHCPSRRRDVWGPDTAGGAERRAAPRHPRLRRPRPGRAASAALRRGSAVLV